VEAWTGEHNHIGQIVQVTETVGRANSQLDFVVGSLAPSIGKPVSHRSNNGIKVPLELFAQFAENRNSAPADVPLQIGKVGREDGWHDFDHGSNSFRFSGISKRKAAKDIALSVVSRENKYPE